METFAEDNTCSGLIFRATGSTRGVDRALSVVGPSSVDVSLRPIITYLCRRFGFKCTFAFVKSFYEVVSLVIVIYGTIGVGITSHMW